MTALTFQLDKSNHLSFIRSSAVIHLFLLTVSCRHETFFVARFITERHFVAMCACSRGACAANNRATPARCVARSQSTIALELALALLKESPRSRFADRLNSLVLNNDLTVVLLPCACWCCLGLAIYMYP